MKGDLQIFARVATIIQDKVKDIAFLRSILDGTCKDPAYKHVDKKQVEDRLHLHQDLLRDLITDIRNGMFNEPLSWLEEEYCSEVKK